MSKFSKKAQASSNGGSNISSEEWKDWSTYLYDVIMEATENGEDLSQVCFISGITDVGVQPPQEAEREYDWEDSEVQNRLIKAGVGRKDEDKFYAKNQDIDSVVFSVDFPSVMVDYSKHPMSKSEEEDLKPYRTLLAGDWDGAASPTSVEPSRDGFFSTKSRIAKLCKATGVKKGKVPSGFDLGELLGAVFTMTIEASWSDDDKWMNVRIGDPAPKHKAIPVPEHNIEPFGIMMKRANDEEDLKQVNGYILKRLQMSLGWDDSPLKQELIKIGKIKDDSSEVGSEEPKKSPPKKIGPKKIETEVPQEPDEEEDFDDDNPYGADED